MRGGSRARAGRFVLAARAVALAAIVAHAGPGAVAQAAVPAEPAATDPPRPLEERALANLVAFTRLLGYVRHFHPSDEAATADWEAFAARGAARVEGAPSPEALATLLEELFRPLAPTVRVAPSEAVLPPLDFGVTRVEAARLPVVSWVHHGYGGDAEGRTYRSERIEHGPNAASDESLEGAVDLYRSVDPAPFRGRSMRVVASVRADGSTGPGVARLAVGIASPGSPATYVSAPDLEARPGAGWSDVELVAEVPEAATLVNLGMHVAGRASVGVDAVRLEVDDGAGGWRRIAAYDFESGQIDADPLAWRSQRSAGLLTYDAEIVEGGARSGARHALVRGRLHASGGDPDPFRPFVAELGGGVTARVPLALYRDALGTRPRAERPPPAGESDGAVSQDGREARPTRLAAVALAWNVLQHFYPYFDVVETDWPAALRAALAKAATDRDDAAFLETLRGLVAALHDGHGRVRHASDARMFVPPLLWEHVDGRPIVTHVEPGAEGVPAVRPGDEIASVDGRPITELLEQRGRLVSAASERWRRRRLERDLLEGVEGSVVELGLRSPGGAARTVVVRRARQAHELLEPRPGPVADLGDGAWYVDLTRVSDDQLAGAVESLAGADAIVFDLRGYPRVSVSFLGHLADDAIPSPRWLVPVVRAPDRTDVGYAASGWSVSPREPAIRGRVAFLADGRAISYAETLLAMIARHGLGEIVGSASAGTNGNINPFHLPGGYTVIWTGMKVLAADGGPHHGVGVAPTVPAARTRDGVAERRDEVLERALEVLRGARPGA